MHIDNVELVVDTDYLPKLFDLLASAQQRIDLIAFSFSIGSNKRGEGASAPMRVAYALKDALEGGVEVRLYIEDKRETSERNRPTAEMLAKAGAQVTYGSSHAKGFCIDGRKVLFGSTNLSHQSLTKNIETNLLFDDDAVAAGFERYFEHLWSGGVHDGVRLDPPMIADGYFEDELIELIDASKERIDFSIYFFDHGGIESALARAAKRGVHVRGLLHTHKSFALSYVRRTEGIARMLAAAGVSDLHWGPSNTFTHSKFLVSDEKQVMLGTGNWLVEDVEIHPQLYVRFENPRLARSLVAHLSTTIDTRATPISPPAR